LPGTLAGADVYNEWIETRLTSMLDDTGLRLAVEQAMARRRCPGQFAISHAGLGRHAGVVRHQSDRCGFLRRDGPALSIDMSLSEVARGKLMVAADEGKAIPLGWALDKPGNPTTARQAGLEGSMLAAAGVKGATLALMVELGAEIYNARIEALLSAMLQDENVRLQGYRRHDLAHRAEQEGL
jgi:hypothetical protein